LIQRAYGAYQAGEIDHTGIIVHYAVPEVDSGPVLVQTIVQFEEEESLDDFKMRMHGAEHRSMVKAAQKAVMRNQLS
jgi:phosphoribosylglycinamide formyltransferase